jgi:hypothetical protein
LGWGFCGLAGDRRVFWTGYDGPQITQITQILLIMPSVICVNQRTMNKTREGTRTCGEYTRVFIYESVRSVRSVANVNRREETSRTDGRYGLWDGGFAGLRGIGA